MSTYMQEIDMFKTFECFGEHQIQNFNNSKYNFQEGNWLQEQIVFTETSMKFNVCNVNLWCGMCCNILLSDI